MNYLHPTQLTLVESNLNHCKFPNTLYNLKIDDCKNVNYNSLYECNNIESFECLQEDVTLNEFDYSKMKLLKQLTCYSQL